MTRNSPQNETDAPTDTERGRAASGPALPPLPSAPAPFPLSKSLRDDPDRLSRVMTATNLAETRAELEAEIRAQIDEERRQGEAIAAEGNAAALKMIAARGRLRAMGVQGVIEARKLMGCNDEPWSDFEADVAYGAADLFLTACRLGSETRAQHNTAIVAKASGRQLDRSIEAGIAASAAQEPAP